MIVFNTVKNIFGRHQLQTVKKSLTGGDTPARPISLALHTTCKSECERAHIGRIGAYYAESLNRVKDGLLDHDLVLSGYK